MVLEISGKRLLWRQIKYCPKPNRSQKGRCYILGTSLDSNLYLNTATRKTQPLSFLQAPKAAWGVDSSWTSSSCACNSRSEEPVSRRVREHQRCQQAPASTFPFKPVLCTVSYPSKVLNICLGMAKKKRGSVKSFIFSWYHKWSYRCNV